MKTLIALVLFMFSLKSPAAEATYTDQEKGYIKAQYGVDVDDETKKLQAKDSAYNSEKETIRQEIEQENYYALAKRADRVTKTWVDLAAFFLDQRGYWGEAERLRDEYKEFANIHLQSFLEGNPDPLESHPPYSAWLESVYQTLRSCLGDMTMRLLHLDDIHEVNYSIPVAFQPAGDKRVTPIHKWPKDEYVLDTSTYFAGPVSYWSIYLICVGATYGTGVAFACSPIGMVAEGVVANYIAPPIADKIWDKYN